MRGVVIAIMVWGLASGAVAQTSPLVNADFENALVAGEGWRLSGDGGAELDAAAPQSGVFSVRLGAGEASASGLRVLSQSFDAEPFRGRVIRFRAAVRTEASARDVGLWLRVDRNAGGSSFLDNMQDRPISSPGWAFYEIVAPVADDTARIAVGLRAGSGDVWIDTASVVDLGPIGAGDASPSVITARGMENLTAFARLYGYVRWFHPTPDGVDWNAVALAGVDLVEGATGPEDLADRLDAVFGPLAPSLRISAGETPPAVTAFGDEPLVRWRHWGVGLGSGSVYRSRLEPTSARDDLTGRLPGGVSFSLPMAAPAPEPGLTLAVRRMERPASFRPTGDDRTTRLSAIVVAWSVLQNFYPYFDVVDADWDHALTTGLEQAAHDDGARAFEATLERLIVPLMDGHGMISPQERSGFLSFQWDWIEERLVVVTAQPNLHLAAGDIVRSIDGIPSAAAIEAEEARISGSPQWRRSMALARLRSGPVGAVRVLEVVDAAGAIRRLEVELEPRTAGDDLREPRPEPISELRPGVWYVDLTRATAAEIAATDLRQATAVIYDLRGYPSGSMTDLVFRGLLEGPVRTAPFLVETAIRPDRDPIGRTEADVSRALAPSQPRWSAQVLFLTDARAISQSETILGVVSGNHLAEIVGSSTAGANGDVITITLPGQYRLRWTGMEVRRHGGGRLLGVGIRPDVEVQRTLAGVRAGRDEVLEAALSRVVQTASEAVE